MPARFRSALTQVQLFIPLVDEAGARHLAGHLPRRGLPAASTATARAAPSGRLITHPAHLTTSP